MANGEGEQDDLMSSDAERKIDKLSDTVREGFEKVHERQDTSFKNQSKQAEMIARIDERQKASVDMQKARDGVEAERLRTQKISNKNQQDGIDQALALAGTAHEKIAPLEKMSSRAKKIFWGFLSLVVMGIVWIIGKLAELFFS